MPDFNKAKIFGNLATIRLADGDSISLVLADLEKVFANPNHKLFGKTLTFEFGDVTLSLRRGFDRKGVIAQATARSHRGEYHIISP